MEFHCTNCNHRLIVADAKAGKKGRCPKCKEVLTVPVPSGEAAKSPHDLELLDIPEFGTDEAPQPEHGDESKTSTSPHDRDLLDAPPSDTDESEAAYDQLQGALGGRLMKPDEIPQRKYPWIIDIFLYPVNVSALTMLLICVGTPFFLRIVVKFFMFATSAIPILIIFWVIALMVHWAALVLLITYMFWYFCQCIQDSAEGQIRAGETMAETPGLGELLGQNLKLIFCALVCLAPAIALWAQASDFDQLPWILSGAGDFLLTTVLPVEVLRRMAEAEQTIPLFGSTQGVAPAFWALWAAGNFVFPMVLLAMVMHESFFAALNPIRIIGSILRTFFQYCALALACFALSFSLSMIYYLILSNLHWHLGYIVLALAFYQMLVMAHLLGRFYWKNQEKLNWDA